MSNVNKSSKLLIIIALALIGSTLCAQALDFPAPQFMLPMYDHFSLNPANTAALGRGQTVTAAVGNIGNAVNNPATLVFDKSYAYMEICIKPPINELNVRGMQVHTSPVPFGLLGVSAKLRKNVFGGLSYSMPKSILQDDFHVVMNQGTYWFIRYPSYNLHQFTATANINLNKFNLGLNVHQQIHHFQDEIILKTFENLDFNFYTLRVQPGILYSEGNLAVGLTYTPKTETDMDMRYADYAVTLPAKAAAGIALKRNNKGYYFDAEWEQYSQMSSKFDDRLTLRAGYESRVRNITYRGGFVVMPGVFEGEYNFPVNTSSHADTSMVWNNVPTSGYIEKTDQLLATGGFTYHFKGGELSFAIMQDFGGNVNTTRVMSSLSFETATFKNKKFLIFD